jgi:hypothetical protein
LFLLFIYIFISFKSFPVNTRYGLFYVTYTNPNLLATNSATSPAVTATTEFPKTAFANSVPSESSLSCLYTTKVASSITHSSADSCIELVEKGFWCRKQQLVCNTNQVTPTNQLTLECSQIAHDSNALKSMDVAIPDRILPAIRIL